MEGAGVRGEINVGFCTISCNMENILYVSLLQLVEGKAEENCILPNE
jgi:hypothetical protein